ncbi:hypothetical protein [Entomobacter blattae]|uniref:DUF4412 domain-containing protein n=1 Tax=Entomobacter blattae TaxID=2762277 RepID=A0A7H1NNI1_9PROT|nr:hypothetical protein [Entomobacter blattae]QNT77341.1 hypothetical protein JGUZn3_00740 [Entomobacter blattae]
MKRFSQISLALLAGVALLAEQAFQPLVAWAEEKERQAPYVTPQRDVDVTYSLLSPFPKEPPALQRMRWSVSTLRQRVDPAKTETYMVTNYRNNTLTVVDPVRKIITITPAPGGKIALPGEKPSTGEYRAQGKATLVGLSCTDWHVTDTEGRPSDVCYTDDGIMLRVVQDGLVMVRATKIDFTSQPDSVFEAPSDYRKIQPQH